VIVIESVTFFDLSISIVRPDRTEHAGCTHDVAPRNRPPRRSVRVRVVRRGRRPSRQPPSPADAMNGNGKHVRSHSLRSFPALAGGANCRTRRPGDEDAGAAADTPAAKTTSTWKQVSGDGGGRANGRLPRVLGVRSFGFATAV